MAKYKFVERRTIEETYIVDISDEDMTHYIELCHNNKDDAVMEYFMDNVIGDEKLIVNTETIGDDAEQWFEEMK